MSEADTTTPLLKARRPWHLITDASQLGAVVEELSKADGPVAVDAERASGFKYSQRAYLVQLSRRNSDIFLIDPYSISPRPGQEEFAILANLINQETWILHAATQDLACLGELGLHPKGLFDTELGSRLAGLPRVGLGAVVEHYLGLGLAKEHSAVDWSTRPLQESWLEYAALDVDILHELADALSADLKEQEKTTFAEEEFEHLLGFKPKPEKIDKWRGVTGLHEIKDQRGLAIARSMWQAREALAIKMDVAPGRLLPDTSISYVARKQPQSRPELAADRGFSGRASRSYLDTWWEAIEVGRNTSDLPPLRLPATGIPNHRIWPNKFPEANKRLVLAKQAIAQQSENIAIPAENLLTPDYLRQLCWKDQIGVSSDDVEQQLLEVGARKWQAKMLCESISAAINQAPSYEIPEKETKAPTA